MREEVGSCSRYRERRWEREDWRLEVRGGGLIGFKCKHGLVNGLLMEKSDPIFKINSSLFVDEELALLVEEEEDL